ncbi:MAG TPA: CBS domain-containing protein [Usitatibacter sp.]|nr:CBS domain-containing protein [Usitatibacter sp.]
MNAKHIMTRPVITIGPDTRVAEIAELLLHHRISGLPVLEGGRVVGIVSEGDLLRRHEIGSERRRPGGWLWQAVLGGGLSDASEYVKSHAVRAADLMTTAIVSVTEDTPLSRIAALFEKRRIRRLPVLRGERLVGLVTRANLVRALALKARSARREPLADDEAIRSCLLRELNAHAWWRATSSVIVDKGVVEFWGLYENEEARRAARVAAENVPGVRRIEDHRMSGAEMPMMG